MSCLTIAFTLKIPLTQVLWLCPTPVGELHGNVYFWLWAKIPWHLMLDCKSLLGLGFFLVTVRSHRHATSPPPLFCCLLMYTLRHSLGTSWSTASILAELQLLEIEAERGPGVSWTIRYISEPCGGSVCVCVCLGVVFLSLVCHYHWKSSVSQPLESTTPSSLVIRGWIRIKARFNFDEKELSWTK